MARVSKVFQAKLNMVLEFCLLKLQTKYKKIVLKLMECNTSKRFENCVRPIWTFENFAKFPTNEKLKKTEKNLART